jgi:hypothetical protein
MIRASIEVQDLDRRRCAHRLRVARLERPASSDSTQAALGNVQDRAVPEGSGMFPEAGC